MPDWRPEILRRLGPARLRPEREAAIADEIAQHLEDRYRGLMASGYTSDDAATAAWRELEEADILGRRVAQLERAAPVSVAGVEAQRQGGFVAGLWQDLHYALRSLRKRPLFTATVIATIALSLGPTTIVFGIANALFFKPLPAIAHQDRLLNYWFGTAKATSVSPWFISYSNADDISRGAANIESMAGYQDLGAGLAVEGASPRLASGAAVSANYFDVLGVRLVAGRAFRADEDRNPGGEPVLIVNENIARAFFGSLDAAIGKTMLVNAEPFTIIGASPQDFAGVVAARRQEFWVTGMAYSRASHVPAERWAYPPNRGPFYSFVVRMTQSATLERTAAELAARTRALADRAPDQNKMFETVGPILQPGFAAPASLQRMAVAAMQLIGCVAALLVLLGMANVANLLIFRGLAAGRDVSVRRALGASAARLVQLRLVESLLLAIAGAAASVGLALLLGGVLSGFALPGVGVLDVAVDWRVLAATGVLALLVGVGFGLAPALLAARESVTGALSRGARVALPRASRLRHALAASQIALSLMLLVGALLFLATLRNLRAVDLGFDPAGVTIVGMNLRGYGYTNARAVDFNHRAADAVRRTPGIKDVALAYSPPMLGPGFFYRLYLPDQDPTQAREIAVNAVSPDYFRALALPLARGRSFTADEAFSESPRDPMPVILSATLAIELFGSIDAIGRELRTPVYQSTPKSLEVVGVTAEARYGGIDSPPDAVLYEPLAQSPVRTSVFMLVRSEFDHARAAHVISAAVATIDPAVALPPERTFNSMIDLHLGQQRLFAWILGSLGAIGFVVAAVGLHGLVAQTVTERTREFAIRLAIGADRTRIMRLVLRRATMVTGVGLAAGLILTWFAGRIVESRLYGVTGRDPWLYALAATAMGLVVAIASAVPAFAATRVNPTDVLRME